MKVVNALFAVTDKFFDAWNQEDRYKAIIGMLLKIIYLLVFIAALCSIGWMTAPTRMTVYIPPDISNGATQKAGEIPNPFIYTFTFEVWQEINHWTQNGTQDYITNINTYWPYFTPSFKSVLLQDYEDLKTSGQLDRERVMQGIEGAAYDSIYVKKLSDNTWEVDLKVRLTEYKNNQVVKDVEILYPLKVVRYNISQKVNPYGLAITGFASEPVRLKTYI